MEKLTKLAQLANAVVQNISNVGGYPLNVTRQVNEKYRLLERQVNELARASGMSDQTYDAVVTQLTQKAAGTQIQVLDMMKNIFQTLGNSVNFQDPVNINAVFGSMDKVNENVGPKGLQTWLKDQLLPTIQKTKEMGLNPKQVTTLISDSVNSSIGEQQNIKYFDPQGQEIPFYNMLKTQDGQTIDRTTGQNLVPKTVLTDTIKNQENLMNLGRSSLVNNSQDFEELLGLKGDKLRNMMDYTQGVRRTLTPIDMRPDDQQRMQALTERELTGLDEEKLRLLLGLEQGMAPGTLLGVEQARNALELAARNAPGTAKALNILPQTATFMNQTTTDPLEYLTNPEKSLTQTTQKAAATKGRLRKIAQIPLPYMNNTGSTYTTNPMAPSNEFTPQPISGQTAWKQDISQADITSDAASQARELEMAAILGQKLHGEMKKAESDANMLAQHIDQFQAGLGNIDQLKRQGVTDETIVGQVKPMMQQLVVQYDNLLTVYDACSQKIETQLQLQLRGDRTQLQGSIAQYEAMREELAAKKQDAVYKQKQTIIDSVTIEQRMKQKLQEVEVSDTLKQTSDVYEKAFGSSIGRGELAASQGAEAKQLWDASQAAAAAGTGMSPVMQARLRQKALEKMKDSISNLDASAQSPISKTDDRVQMLGM